MQFVSINTSQALQKANLQQLQQYREELSKQRAIEILVHKDVRALLCPALATISGDAFEIAKIVTTVLATAAISGTIAIPLVPALFASIAFVISRIGVASLCDEYVKKTPPAAP